MPYGHVDAHRGYEFELGTLWWTSKLGWDSCPPTTFEVVPTLKTIPMCILFIYVFVCVFVATKARRPAALSCLPGDATCFSGHAIRPVSAFVSAATADQEKLHHVGSSETRRANPKAVMGVAAHCLLELRRSAACRWLLVLLPPAVLIGFLA